MKCIFVKMKLHCYVVTLVLAIILFIIEGARPTHHVLDSPLVYGYLGHILLLALTFIVSMYLGITKTYNKWLYPSCVVLFIYIVVPYIALIFINQPEVTRYFLSAGFLFYGFIFVFLPHIVAPLLGMGLGILIYKVGKHGAK